jgi:hypothetical protein
MNLKKIIKYKNLVFSKPKFFAKKIYKKYLKVQMFNLNHLARTKDYSFKTRLYFFNTFKYKTSKRLIYGRHIYLMGHMVKQLTSSFNCFGFAQVAIQKKIEFPLFREFLYKYDLKSFLFTKKNFKYITLYNFSYFYMQALLCGGYNFVIVSTNDLLILKFLLKKIYLNFFLNNSSAYAKSINLNFLRLNQIDLEKISDLEFNFFKRITFLHYKFFDQLIPAAFLEKFLTYYFSNPLFAAIEILSKNNIWLIKSIFYLINYYFRLNSSNLLIRFRTSLVKN